MALKYKNTSITISNDGGFSTISNELRYKIESELQDAATLEQVFPNINFKLVGGKLVYGSEVSVTNMWDLINTFKIEQSDVDKSVKEAIQIWSINIIYSQNLLGLEINDWSVE